MHLRHWLEGLFPPARFASTYLCKRIRRGRGQPGLQQTPDVLEDRTLLSAVVIEVTTLEDVVDPDDGVTSLREAVQQANVLDEEVEIRLMLPGTYELTAGQLLIQQGASTTVAGLGTETTIIDAGGLGHRLFDVSSGGTLSIHGITLTGGTRTAANDVGGAIRNFGGTVSINESLLTGNAARSGGAIMNSFGTLMITNSTISGNAAEITGGGAISNGSGQSVQIFNSTITNNSAVNAGGGITTNGPLTVIDSTISGNTSQSSGGAIFGGGGVTLQNSVLSGNSASSWGGALHLHGPVTITESTISGNVADGGNGGGMTAFQTTLEIADSTFSGNSALQGDGGGVHLSAHSSAEIVGSTFSDNTASETGGGIAIASDTNVSVQISRSIFSENSATDGGGLSNMSRALTVTECEFLENTASRNGGAISWISGSNFSDLTLHGSTISGNRAQDSGGGIFARGAVTITDSTLSENVAESGSGGGLASWLGQVNLVGTTLSANASQSYGGAVANQAATLNLTDSYILENLTFGSGGGLATGIVFVGEETQTTVNTTTLSRSTISNNRADEETEGGGGGIFSTGSSTLILHDSAVAQNETPAVGGGIFNLMATVEVEGSSISSNSAGPGGGGIYNFMDGSLHLTSSLVSGNTSEMGAGIFNDGFFTASNSTIATNTAVDGGGGIFNQGTSSVAGSTISSNSGGGAWNWIGSLTITNSTISGNAGGGVLGMPGENTITINHTTVTGNTDGAGIAQQSGLGSRLVLHHTIAAGNLLSGGTARDIDVLDLEELDLGSAFNLIGAPSPFVGDPEFAGGLIHGANGNIIGDGEGNPLDVNLVLDLELKDNGGPTHTHALVSGSPAINAGDPDFHPNAFFPPLEFDQRGQGFARAVGRVDIGAFEFGAQPPREGVMLFDDSTGRWHVGRNVNERFQHALGHRWSADVAWDFHQGDFTGNGLLDVAGRQTNTGQWFVFSATDEGFSTTYWGRWGSDESAGWSDVLVGDFNGDGRDDIVGRTANGQLWVGESDGSRFVSRYYGDWSASGWGSQEWAEVVVGDFNGDGKDGIAGMRETGHWFFAQTNEAGRFTTTLVGRWSGTAGWQNVMSADFTGDGRSDLIGQTASGQWWIGASNVTSLNTYYGGVWSTTAGFDQVLLGDFNGNGLADLASRNDAGEWWLLLSNGLNERMTTQFWGRWSATADWHTLVGDFTGNGRDDIAGYNADNGQFWVAASTGERFENRFFGQWPSLGSIGFAGAGPLGG